MVAGLSLEEVRRALAIFLSAAYQQVEIPETRRQFAHIGESETLDGFFARPGVQRLEAPDLSHEGGWSLRVGNAWYPHMKVTIQPYGRPPGYVFGVETHDRFNLPPSSPEAEALRVMQERNLQLARKVEAEWEAAGLPTAKGQLRRALAEARAARAAAT